MPAPFTASLCGYRDKKGTPNTSDSHDTGSVEFGHALFAELGVPAEAPAVDDVGQAMEEAIVKDLRAHRPDLFIERSQPARDFEQYAHLAIVNDFRSGLGHESMLRLAQVEKACARLPDDKLVRDLRTRLQELRGTISTEDDALRAFLETLPDESLLKIDVAIGIAPYPRRLLIALSSKWTLRTDRAQDPVSQGNKLMAQRRGHAPHFAVITMEPRPAMLRLLADGSGSIDCVYVLDLPALVAACAAIAKNKGPKWSPAKTLSRLVDQNRVRDYDVLIEEIAAL